MTDVPPGEPHVPIWLAVQLAVALNRMGSRLRQEEAAAYRGTTVSELATLQRLADRGPMTITALAASEHVSHQAIAKRVETLRLRGHVVLEPDPSDRRRKLVRITAAGRGLLRRIAGREDWLARAISAVVAEDELPTLAKAVELLGRLASAELPERSRR